MTNVSFKPKDINSLLFFVLLLFLFWQLKRGWDKSAQAVVSQNAGTDLTSQQAIQLRQAMNPSGSGFLIGDGTDEDSIMATAATITDYKAVYQAYKTLYGSDLTADLTGELSREELAQFWAVVNGNVAKPATTGTTATTGTSTGTSTAKPAPSTTLAGKTVTAITTANIRIDKSPYGVETNAFGQNKQATKGMVLGKYVSEKMIPDVPNKGNRNTFVRYSEGTYITSYHWIVKTAVSIK